MRVISWRNYIALTCLIALSGGSTTPLFVSAQQDDTSGWSAGKLRSRSDEAMAGGDYALAVDLIKKAILLEPESTSNWYKLFRLHHRKHKYVAALDAITQAAEKQQQQKSSSDKEDYRLHKARLLVQLGQCDRAVKDFEEMEDYKDDEDYAKARSCDSTVKGAEKAFYEEDYLLAARLFEKSLGYVEVFAPDLVWLKAQSLYKSGDYYGVISDTGKLLKHHSQHIDAYHLRGEAYFRLNEHEQAVLHYREGLKLDPEHKACKEGHKLVKSIEKKKKKGDDAYDKQDYQNAIDQWTAATEIDTSHVAFNRPMALKIAIGYSKLGNHKKAMELAQQHIDEDETVEGLWALGEIELAAEKYEDAVRTYTQATETANEDQKKEAQQKLREAQVALKQSKEKNYYKILGIPRNARKQEIKKAYRELALKWHPDKVAEEEKEKGERMFQDIGEAYEVLSDEELRAKYDRGEEVFENQGGGQRHHTDPFQFFNSQFHGGGGGRGHGRQGFHVRWQN